MKARLSLLLALVALPEDAFQYFVGWSRGMPINFPEGLAGFSQTSRDAILELRQAARDYTQPEETRQPRYHGAQEASSYGAQGQN